MVNKKYFDDAIEEWAEHCKNNAHISNPDKFLDCDAYRRIVSMGYDALPLIRRLYDKNNLYIDSLELASLVRNIVKNNFSIPKKIKGNVPAIRIYTKKWLDDYLK